MGHTSRGATVGERIARERDRQRMSLSAFSRKVDALAPGARGTSRTALRNLEEGRVDSPSKEVVEAVADVLGVEERWLWTGDPPRFRPDPATRPGARRGIAAAPAAPAAPPRRSGPDPRLERAPVAPPIPPTPRDHAAWGPGVARTIGSECLLASAPEPVRTRFWSLLEEAADRRASGVSGPDDLIRLARRIDAAVLRPLALLRPGQRHEGPWFESYALEILERFAGALGGGGATARSSRVADAGDRRPGTPPSLRGSGSSSRRERDGLTWRLM